MKVLQNAIAAAATAWHETKLFIEHVLEICHDTLHIIAGIAIWLALIAIGRRTIKEWMPWLFVLAVALLNETVDLWVEIWPTRATQLGEGARDVLMTIAIPLVLVVVARTRPSIFDLGEPGTGKIAKEPTP